MRVWARLVALQSGLAGRMQGMPFSLPPSIAVRLKRSSSLHLAASRDISLYLGVGLPIRRTCTSRGLVIRFTDLAEAVEIPGIFGPPL